MHLTSYVIAELRNGNPNILEDIQTFHKMQIDEKLRVTDPDAYVKQHENLDKIKTNYKTVMEAFIETHLDKVVEGILDGMTDTGFHTISSSYINANSLSVN